jgi:Uma2 family endonuclease
MADTAHRRWTLQEYLDWEERQETRNEFVNGAPRAMTGGTKAHGRVAGNVFTYLHGRLAGKRCAPDIMNTKVMIPAGNVRYPDVLVDCGPFRANDIAAVEPTVVVEVYSKSTTVLDQTDKLDEYQSIPSMQHIVHLRQSEARGDIWTRNEKGWTRVPFSGLDAGIDLTAIGVTIPLSVVYDGVPLGEDAEDAAPQA